MSDPSSAGSVTRADRRHERQRLGDEAEALAGRHVQAEGLLILERGFRRRVGEIDLIALDPLTGTVIFVEVRYRSSLSYGGPLASVTAHKRQRLLRATRAWLAVRRVDPRRPVRIDVIGITLPAAVRGRPEWRHVEGHALCWVKHAVHGGV